MKVLKVVFGIVAILAVIVAMLIAFAYDKGTIVGFWRTMAAIVALAILAALCVLGAKIADDTVEASEARKYLLKDAEENAPTSANR